MTAPLTGETVTADTLTDEQIRALQIEAHDHNVTVLARYALRLLACNACRVRARRGFDGQRPSCAVERTNARSALAEIYNTRSGVK